MGSNETRNLWLSILFGVFASFLIYSYSQEKKAEYDKKFGAIKTVVVAKNDIRELEIINETIHEIHKTHPRSEYRTTQLAS